MGASETKILYQKDIEQAFPAGEIDLSIACQVIKCTPAPKNTIEDFSNFSNYHHRNNHNLRWFLLLLLIYFLLLQLI